MPFTLSNIKEDLEDIGSRFDAPGVAAYVFTFG